MDLVVWRHAEAHEALPGGVDLERDLTPRGAKQAKRMALWLDRHIPDSCRVLCSPARRSEQTALALDRKYKVRAELGPDGSLAQVLELVQWPHSKASVLVVGHQPLLGLLVAQLTGLRPEDCAVKKGAVWWLRTKLREDGTPRTVIWTVQNPDTV